MEVYLLLVTELKMTLDAIRTLIFNNKNSRHA